MAFGKKKKKDAAKEEEPVQAPTQEATEEAPEPDAPVQAAQAELTPEQLAAHGYARAFVNEYDGLVQYGTDSLRANLLMAIFAEQRRTNELLEELIELVKEGNA